MASSTPLNTYTKKERNMYLIGLAGQNILFNVIGSTLAYYLQFTLLIPAMAVSVLMAIGRVWDGVNDPIMGSIVDRTRTKWGKCRPYLIFTPIPVGIATILCFANGIFDVDQGVWAGKNAFIMVWAACAYLIWEIAYTLGDIPLWGITALMSESADDRNKILSLARLIAGIGGGVALLGLQPVCLALGGFISTKFHLPAAEGERWGFIAGAVIFTLAGTAMYQMAGLFTKERIQGSEKKNSVIENIKLMWKNKPFRQILLSGVLGSPKQLLMLCAMPLVTYYYASKSPLLGFLYILLLGGGMFIGMFIGMGVTPKLIKKHEKKTLYNFANLAMIVPHLLVFVLYLTAPTNLIAPFFLAICFVLFFIGGSATGMTMVLQSQMIADAIDYEEYHNNVRPDGVFFAGQTFIAKLTMGVATIISGIAYSLVGFSDAEVARVNSAIEVGLIPRMMPEFQPYMAVLFFLVAIPPAIGGLLAVIPTWKYALPNKEHEKILAALNERRHAEHADAAVNEG
ncbi:MAG: MFS transporter [Oscillospiraceae bacterium]|jgi:Na+/melibiose symporter-like transporter|nr:MFS transporter [Oscillospiraceae bacterium]